MSDFKLSQLVSIPTHCCGHILDWAMVCSEDSLVSLEGVQDYAVLLDHYVVICHLALTKPPPSTWVVTSKNIRVVCSSDFQADVKALIDSTGEQRLDVDQEDLIDVYDDGLRQVLDHHDPSVNRHIGYCPFALWMYEEVRAAQQQRRQAK